MFGFPKVQRAVGTHFKSNFLQSVVFQVRYPQIDASSKKADILPIISDLLPNCEDIVEAKFEVPAINKTNIHLKPIIESTIQGFTVFAKDGSKKLDITSEALTYTIAGKSYSSFSNFISEFHEPFVQISELLGITAFNRIAIRKTNVLQYNLQGGQTTSAQALNLIFNNALVDNLQKIPSSEKIIRSIFNINFQDENKHLILNYGLLPTAVSSENALLDIDVFFDSNEYPVRDYQEYLKLINDTIYDIFIWSLQPDTIESLNQ